MCYSRGPVTSKMKPMKNKILFAALALGAASAFAADAPFTGPSIGVAFGASHNKINFGGFLAGNTSSDTDSVGKISAGYGFALTSSWVLNAGAEYTFGKQKFGNTTYTAGGTQTVHSELKNDWSLFAAPGYRVAPNAIVYGKLAYHNATGRYTDTLPATGETTHNGVGYGVGYAYALGRNIELNAEYNHIDYSRESAVASNGKPKQDMLTIGLGYRF